MDKKGMGHPALMVLLTLFILMVLYGLLDHVIREDIIATASEVGLDNETRDNLLSSWNLYPWVVVLGSFFYLLVWALSTSPYSRGK